MKRVYSGVSMELITPQISSIIDSYVTKWHKKNLRQADMSSMLGELTGYDLIENKTIAAGWCDASAKQIAMSSNLRKPYKLLFHEIGHAIQGKLGNPFNETRLISSDLWDEQQAETISWILHSKCFPDRPVKPSQFNSYFRKEDVKFLIDWYGSSRQNDLEYLFINPPYETTQTSIDRD